MKTSPLAGKPAEPSMLVNVPKLVTAYYTDAPDPSVPGQRVAFGTSGHRGSAFKKAFNSAPIGGLKVIAGSGWFAARPSGTEEIYKIYAESSRTGSSARYRGGSTGHRRCCRGGAHAAAGDSVQDKTEGQTMSKQPRVSHPIYNLLPTEIEGFDSLAELGPGYAFVVESCHRPSVAAAGSCAVGAHA